MAEIIDIPHSVEIEKAVLGCCVLEPELAEVMVATCDESCFYSTLSKNLFHKIKELHTLGELPDLTVLIDKIKEPDLLVFLTDCCDSVTYTASFDTYLKRLQDYRIKRKLQELGRLTQNINGVDVNELISMLEQQLAALRPVEREDKKQQLDAILDEYAQLKERGFEMKSGFPSLDKFINGFRRKRLYILGGEPGSGKTGLALFLAQRIAFEDNKKVLFFSLEMSTFDIAGRLTSIFYKVPSHRIQQCWYMTKEDFVHLTNAVSKLYKTNLEVESGNWQLGEVIAKIKQSKPDIVFIDHLQYIPLIVQRREEATHEILSQFVKSLREIAKKENICMFLISQKKKDTTIKHKQPTSHTEFKGASGIKEQADLGMMIDRPEPKKEDKNKIMKKPDGYFELHIVKNRNGRMGYVKMLFEPETLCYREYAERPTEVPVGQEGEAVEEI